MEELIRCTECGRLRSINANFDGNPEPMCERCGGRRLHIRMTMDRVKVHGQMGFFVGGGGDAWLAWRVPT